jgi:hypothetical protein
MNESPNLLELLSIRLDELEKRVHALEHSNEAKASTAILPAEPFAGVARSSEADLLQPGNLFPTLGRAMLGIAGAYVLRAIAQAGLMPKVVVAAVGVVYALAWLVWAARSTKASSFVQIVYAGTSVLILMPMLWETTLYFQVFPASATAGVLAAFAVLATALAWNGERASIVRIAHGAATVSAIALAIATHHVLPFIYLLLIAVLLNECARAASHKQDMASLVALLADAAIWGMIFIYSGPQNARAEYPELASVVLIIPACLLFVINGTGVTIQAIAHERTISIFDAIQTMIAFLLAVVSMLLFASPIGTAVLGIACLALSGALYPASFRRLRQLDEPRNFRVFGMWSLALLLAGVLWMLPRSDAGMALAGIAVVVSLLAKRMNSTMLDLHGAIFLTAGAGISAMAQYTFGMLAGSLPGKPPASFVIVACSAVVAFVILRSTEGDSWQKQVLAFIPALIAACSWTALLAYGVVASAALVITLDVHHVAFLRTLTVSVVALVLAYAGARLGRETMTRIAYIALAFVAVKLLIEDLRHGHMEFIAGSIFLFAITLIAVPQLARHGARLRAAHLPELIAASKN